MRIIRVKSLEMCRIKLTIYFRKHFFCYVFIMILLICCVLKQNTVRKSDIAHMINDKKMPSSNLAHKNNNSIQRSDLPILVVACNRPSVRRCLQTLIKYRPAKETFPIVVSQDCGHEPTYQIIKSFADRDPTITVVRQPNRSQILRSPEVAHMDGYYRIARHYKFALNHIFRTLQHKAVIVVEDDLLISPDFFEYFLATLPLLYEDPTIWCVSAWNDNCKKDLVDLSEPALLHRTNFFPGLGWLIRSETWEELEPHWPQAFFDDWLRHPGVSRGRVCIRPEISRTYHMGIYGVSNGQFDDGQRIYNKEFTLFSRINLYYLLKKHESKFVSYVYSLPTATSEELILGTVNSSWEYVRIPYEDVDTFKIAAKRLGLMDDLTHGVPRTALHGIVQCFFKGRRVYLARVPSNKTRSTSALRRPETSIRKDKQNVNMYEESLEY